MPPLPHADQVCKVDLRLSNVDGSNQGHMIMHAKKTTPGPWTSTDLTALITPFGSGGTANPCDPVAAQISHRWGWRGITATDLGGTGLQATGLIVVTTAYGPDEALPPQCAVAWSWRIARSYRGGKPRNYMPGVPTTATVTAYGSAIQLSYATSLRNNVVLFLNRFNAITVTGGTVALGNLSYRTGGALRPTPLFDPFVDVHVHERLDSQRRRSGKESAFSSI
jgi:hypothetical protein